MVKNKKNQESLKKQKKKRETVQKMNRKKINPKNMNKSKISKGRDIDNDTTETNNKSVLELMTKFPKLNQTFEYILYSNKYKHSLTDVFNIVKMLSSKLEELQDIDVNLTNTFETINYNYKIKGLVQSTAINLYHVLEQLNVNESTFLSFAHNFSTDTSQECTTNDDDSTTLHFKHSPMEVIDSSESTFINFSHPPLNVINDNDKIRENVISSTNMSVVPEKPRAISPTDISPVCNYSPPNFSKKIKTENIITTKHNTGLFGYNYAIVLSSDDEYEELFDVSKNKSKTQTEPIKIEDDMQSYILGSDFTDILPDTDNSPNLNSSSGQNQYNTIPKLSPKNVTRVRNRSMKQNEKGCSNKDVYEARKSDLRLIKRLNERKHTMLNIVNELNLQPNDIVLEFDIINKESLVTIHKDLAKVLKKHQVEGVRFLWNTVFETIDKANNTDGTGCVLAHRMGIGKTLQIISLMYTILSHSQINIKTFLIICPPGLIYSWMDEIYKWLKDIDKDEIVKVYDLPKTNKLYNITNIAKWKSDGGILILSYGNFKSLVNCKQSDLKEAFSYTLVNPGPDVVILDEGHYIKNTNTILLKSLTQIKTKRRIVLTGTPMQNSLKEYYTLVDFVKPNILGNFKDFSSTFIKPIESGQFFDSCDETVKKMKEQSFILHRLLQQTVHRIDEARLQPLFTEKIEYIVEVNMTEFQCELYKKFLSFNINDNAFVRLHVLTLITLHPLTLYRLVHYKNNKHLQFLEPGIKHFIKTLSWIKGYGEDQRFFELKYSNKILYLLNTIDECQKRNEKILCFLKSPLALDILEYFLHKEKNWILGVDYFRMDGKVNLSIRNQMCEAFNNSENPVKLFIISLGTGVLGYNMVGANRVLLLNTSWNPSNDIQAIYRCLRFGQKKIVYVNRLLAKGTIEPKAYYRQINKLGMASSVIDLQHMSRKVSLDQTNDLFTFDSSKTHSILFPNTKDPVLNQLIRNNHASISDLKEHDSMLVESVEDQLTVNERKNLWSSFKNTEIGNSSFIQPKPSKNMEQQRNINNKSPHTMVDIKQEIDDNFSGSTNRLNSKEPQCTIVNESQNTKYFTNSNNPGSSKSHTFTDKHTKSPNKLTTEFKTNNFIDKHKRWKQDEPIQNQFKHFQQKSFSHHKRYPSTSNFRYQNAARTYSSNNSNNEKSSSNHDLYNKDNTWNPNERTPTANNIKNRSGMHR